MTFSLIYGIRIQNSNYTRANCLQCVWHPSASSLPHKFSYNSPIYKEPPTLLLLCVVHALPVSFFSIWSLKYLIQLWLSCQLPPAYPYCVHWLRCCVAVQTSIFESDESLRCRVRCGCRHSKDTVLKLACHAGLHLSQESVLCDVLHVSAANYVLRDSCLPNGRVVSGYALQYTVQSNQLWFCNSYCDVISLLYTFHKRRLYGRLKHRGEIC